MIYLNYSTILIWIISNTLCLCANGYEKFSTGSSLKSHSTSSEQTEDSYVDESKFHRASHQHEEALLAAIYSPERHYISFHEDQVDPLNYTYFTLNRPGTYRFILITLRGDADLYLSTRDKHVTYENYELSSCTCGIDEILVDHRMKRPIYVGIYGYSRYQTSKYRLLVELVNSSSSSGETTTDADRDSGPTQEQSGRDTDRKASRIVEETNNESEHTLWTLILHLLEFLADVLG